MCGRFALYEPEWRMVWERLNGGNPTPVKPTKPDEGELRPGWNISPMQRTACVLAKGEEIKGALALWSLVPPWHKEPLEQKRYATFNAKSEEILQKPAFRGYTFTILTTGPNPLMEKIHNRMPVIVPRESYMAWLTAPAEEALKLTEPFPSQLMTAWPVGKEVGNVRNQGPELAAEISHSNDTASLRV